MSNSPSQCWKSHLVCTCIGHMRTVTVSWIHVLFCLGDTISLESIPASYSDSISIPFPHKSLNLEVGAGFANEISLLLRVPQLSHSTFSCCGSVDCWINYNLLQEETFVVRAEGCSESYFIALFIFLPFLFSKRSILSRSHYYLFISFFKISDLALSYILIKSLL